MGWCRHYLCSIKNCFNVVIVTLFLANRSWIDETFLRLWLICSRCVCSNRQEMPNCVVKSTALTQTHTNATPKPANGNCLGNMDEMNFQSARNETKTLTSPLASKYPIHIVRARCHSNCSSSFTYWGSDQPRIASKSLATQFFWLWVSNILQYILAK